MIWGSLNSVGIDFPSDDRCLKEMKELIDLAKQFSYYLNLL